MKRVPRRLLLVIINVCLAGVLGCSTGSAVRIGATTVSFEDVVARADERDASFRSLHGDGTLQIESPDFSQSASFDVVLLRPDSLQLVFKGPFGITVAQALLTRETFQLYNSLQNKLYVGATSPENLERTVRIGLTFDDILSLFSGGTVLAGDRHATYTPSSDAGDAVFLFTDGRVHRRYVIDPETRSIKKLQLLNEKGAPIGEQSFTLFETSDGISYPRKITLTQHTERRRLTLFYDSIEWNGETSSSFTFSVPDNAERVTLK